MGSWLRLLVLVACLNAALGEFNLVVQVGFGMPQEILDIRVRVSVEETTTGRQLKALLHEKFLPGIATNRLNILVPSQKGPIEKLGYSPTLGSVLSKAQMDTEAETVVFCVIGSQSVAKEIKGEMAKGRAKAKAKAKAKKEEKEARQYAA